MGRVTKELRTDAVLPGIRISVRSKQSEGQSSKRKLLDETWADIYAAAEAAAEDTRAVGQDHIRAIDRVESGYMADHFDVRTSGRKKRNYHVSIGWLDWSKTPEYYDFQERGTLSHRIAGYGGARMFSTARTPEAKAHGVAAARKGGNGSGGIKPMNMLPGMAVMFRHRFRARLDEERAKRGR